MICHCFSLSYFVASYKRDVCPNESCSIVGSPMAGALCLHSNVDPSSCESDLDRVASSVETETGCSTGTNDLP